MGLGAIKRMFCDARPIDVWMLVIEALVLLLIFLDVAWRVRVWCSARAGDSMDRKVMAYLGGLDAGVKKTVDEVVVGISDAEKPETEKVAESLQRLSDKFQVENDAKGGWYKIRRYVAN